MSAIDAAAPSAESRAAPTPSGVSAWVMGTDPTMRINIQRTLLAFSIYAVWMVVEAVCASLGLVKWSAVAVIYAFNSGAFLLFYSLLRSGFSERFKDPSMVLAQSVYAMLALMIVYVTIPPTRAADLQTLCLISVFGMFTLKPREIVIACAWSIGLMLSTFALTVWWRPTGFDLEHESINVAVVCVVLPAMTAIIRHFALLRAKLKAQRAELKAALARVQELATRDALTHLTNRAHMQEILNQEVLRHQRHGAVFCLALIDIDHFKRINDRHGHQIGDEVLVGFAAQATRVQRQSDFLARWGGEEFLILLPQTPADCALQALERLREAVAGAALSTSVPSLKVTISAGIAQWKPGESLAQTLERADKALYAAKHGGRNECAVAQ